MTDFKPNMKNNISAYQRIETGSRFLCMFSGGKDSGLAMAIAIAQGAYPAALLHIREEKESLYHKQSSDVIEAQAKAIHTKVIYLEYKWWRNWDKAKMDLNKINHLGAKYIVFGDIRPKYMLIGDIPLCEQSGYEAYLPLGNRTYEELMQLIEEHRIVSIITRINHPSINQDLLGVPFSREIYNHFIELGIDPFGENDEFHTTLVDADFFSAPLDYSLTDHKNDKITVKIERDSGNTGGN